MTVTSGRQEPGADVVVVGGGIVGLAIAWSAARTGRSVRLFDPAPAQGATFAAAGMLAPVSEYHYQEDALLDLMIASAARYPGFVEALVAESRAVTGDSSTGGGTAGYQTTETFLLGVDHGDRQALADLYDAYRVRGLEVEPLPVRQLRAREPWIGPRVTSGYCVAGDHQVDPRVLAGRLLDALTAAPEATLVPERVVAVVHADPSDADSRVVGVRSERGTVIAAGEVVLANSLGAREVEGLPNGLALPLRPVGGDILRLRVPVRMRPMLTATVRALVHGESVYLVPRADGTLVVGASQREDGLAGVSAGGVYRLLRDAQEVLPAVADLELIEATARPRPATPDNAPLLGRARDADGIEVPGLVVATGFFRHGILLAPIAADICLRLTDGRGSGDTPECSAFRPDRFWTEPAAATAAERKTA